MPQIEVAFDIDANGILNVSAKDKATGKEQSIVIKASSGLSDDEIENMVKDAEAHAEDDRKFQELVNARNQADSLVHATKKSVEELADQVTDEERKEIEEATAAVEKALENDDVAEITEASQRLGELSGKMAQKAYEAAQAKEGGDAAGAAETDQADATDENVVDADFEEVKDDK